jgi:histone-lysine N-methyltransferase ASH1L
MTFPRGLIIDATDGSICRFVNYSCSPNCRVEKWVVDGELRIALFASEKGVSVDDELTYDYDFAYVYFKIITLTTD